MTNTLYTIGPLIKVSERGKTKPPQVILWRDDQWHPIVDFGHQLVCISRDHRERPDPLA